jgi:hypothetical protein
MGAFWMLEVSNEHMMFANRLFQLCSESQHNYDSYSD